jgi:hypothetical protein
MTPHSNSSKALALAAVRTAECHLRCVKATLALFYGDDLETRSHTEELRLANEAKESMNEWIEAGIAEDALVRAAAPKV